MDWTNQVEVLAHVALAMLFGGIVGIERQLADKPAGLRTQVLVAGAAALFVGLAGLLTGLGVEDGAAPSDPVRVIQAIVTGVSFLGAGTIFRRSDDADVEGLTTAASLLVCAGIGIAVALGQYGLALGVALLALVVLRGLSAVDRWLAARKHRG